MLTKNKTQNLMGMNPYVTKLYIPSTSILIQLAIINDNFTKKTEKLHNL